MFMFFIAWYEFTSTSLELCLPGLWVGREFWQDTYGHPLHPSKILILFLVMLLSGCFTESLVWMGGHREKSLACFMCCALFG